MDNGLPEYVSFDHDLADISDSHKEKTGYDCVKWLVDYCIDNKIIKFPNYQVHSANPIGKKNITSYVENGCAAPKCALQVQQRAIYLRRTGVLLFDPHSLQRS